MKNIKVSFRPFPQNCFTFQAPRRSGCKQVVHTFCLCHGQLLRAVLEATSRDVVQLIVCGVLAVGRSLTQRRDLLTAFGFKEKDRVSIQLDSVTLTWVAGGALLIVFLCSTVYFFALNAFDGTQLAGMARDLKNDHLNVIPRDMHMVLWWSVIACLMHLLTLTGGYVLQRSLENSRERLQIGRPRPLAPRAQVAEAIWAASFGFSLTIYMLAALAAAAGRFETLNNCWWWATVPGVTAFFAALYTQKVERLSRQLNLFFWMQGAVTGLVSILVFILLYSDALWGKVAQQLSGDAQLSVLAFGLYVGITTAILGLALGRILHMWVTSERYAGQSDRRHGKRRSFLFKRADPSVLVMGVRADAPPFSSCDKGKSGQWENCRGYSVALCQKIAERAIEEGLYCSFRELPVGVNDRFHFLPVGIVCRRNGAGRLPSNTRLIMIEYIA